ncbi:MAG: hypothetical protein ACM3SW_20570 [Actinomycetota bacterium]
MRQIAAKAIILLLAIIIAVILVAPEVSPVPAVSRTDWSACLLVVFMTWLAVVFGLLALIRARTSSIPRDSLLLPALFCGPPASSPCVAVSPLRC